MRKFLMTSALTYLIFNALNAEAAIDPSTLVKVTPENNNRCVEHYIYNNESYCSTTAQHTQSIDPNIKDYEKQKITFDNRVWQAVWGKKTATITTVEYVVNGEDVNQWHELVISQFFPGLEHVSPQKFASAYINAFKPYNIATQFFQKTANQVILLIKVKSPLTARQNEVVKITNGKDGLYLLHYETKEAEIEKADQMKWVNNFKVSQINQS